MPDVKFSWRGLREHLRKYWIIYLVGVALGLFGAELLWTVTRPTIPNDASVDIYLAAPTPTPGRWRPSPRTCWRGYRPTTRRSARCALRA